MKTASNSRVLRTITLVLMMGLLCSSAYGKIIYVDDDSIGANDGTSWENAYNFLQDALADANSAAKPVEIRVAQGLYTPDSNSTVPDGTGYGEATFQLINDVILKGGFAGVGELDPDVRDVGAYETVLSGDLNGDAESCHVVTGSSTDETAVLDGFIITGGNAGEKTDDRYGGGMYNYEGSPTLTNCTFSHNSASEGGRGGGMCNLENSSPNLTNCTFSGNSAHVGGGMYNRWNSRPILTNCTFRGNFAWGDLSLGGGGMCNWGSSSPTLTNCTFSGNCAIASYGGGMSNWRQSRPTLTNCTFSGNWAQRRGGGMYNYQSSPFLTTLTNCILWGNRVTLMGNGLRQISGSAAVSYSNIQGGFPGEGNIDTDPLFVDLGYWHDNNTPDEPRDDYWVDGDYHLKSQAGRFDQTTQAWVKDDVTSPCIDAGDPLSPVMYEPHPRGCIINMGAYGGTEEASKSPFGCSYEADGE